MHKLSCGKPHFVACFYAILKFNLYAFFNYPVINRAYTVVVVFNTLVVNYDTLMVFFDTVVYRVFIIQ
jgi:hypothetical protein